MSGTDSLDGIARPFGCGRAGERIVRIGRALPGTSRYIDRERGLKEAPPRRSSPRLVTNAVPHQQAGYSRGSRFPGTT